jgi:hypothetical protein
MPGRGSTLCLLALGLVAAMAAPGLHAQGRGRGAAAPPVSARAGAPADFTGYWVSVVTEQWHLRMLVPPKGDFSLIPLNGAARKVADAWDPAKEAAGNECAPYGAAAIMRVPGRLSIHWTDDNTLQLDTDAGTQSRLFRFGSAAPPDQAAQWQGNSVAAWERPAARGRAGAPAGFGRLMVTTTRMRPGYLRRNGVPYSASATVQEHFERFSEPNGDAWLVVTGIVTDPQYLTQPYVTTVHFKKIPDKSGWDPTPCRLTEAR